MCLQKRGVTAGADFLIVNGQTRSMFEFDYSKMFLVGVVALIIIGPKDLPRVLRMLGQVAARVRRIRGDFQNQVMDVIKEADVDGAKKEFEAMSRATHMDIAVNPRTAMRGALPVDAAIADSGGAAALDAARPIETTYSSPEMRDYLAPLNITQTMTVEATPAVAEKAAAHPIGDAADQENDSVANSQSLLAPSSA